MAEVCDVVTWFQNKSCLVVGVQRVQLVIELGVGVDEGLVFVFVGNDVERAVSSALANLDDGGWSGGWDFIMQGLFLAFGGLVSGTEFFLVRVHDVGDCRCECVVGLLLGVA